MAPHSKTCYAIPAHLHVIELLCFDLQSLPIHENEVDQKWQGILQLLLSINKKNVDGMHGASFL